MSTSDGTGGSPLRPELSKLNHRTGIALWNLFTKVESLGVQTVGLSPRPIGDGRREWPECGPFDSVAPESVTARVVRDLPRGGTSEREETLCKRQFAPIKVGEFPLFLHTRTGDGRRVLPTSQLKDGVLGRGPPERTGTSRRPSL